MTQLPQDEFETCLEKAEAWMKEIHERLKENDNTQGPRSALECRLRETEKICALEPDGKLLLDMVLSKAEAMLGESSDDEKHEVHVKLGKLKTMFEETTIYMTHCHSRIEWVWLHWNEYLRARDEFTSWAHNMTLLLEPEMELQLGLKEKRWQYEQALVLIRDVGNQSKLLERLLEEASSLYNRIGDPSVDEGVQNAMADQYQQIKKKVQERAKRLEKIWKDHEAYQNDINLFKSWLNDVIEKLKCCIGLDSESTETRLHMLQEIGKDVEIGKKQLEDLEEKSADVVKNTSPLGAEKICKELEELRRTLRELKMMNDEEEESLLKTYNSENAFVQLARQLEANINEFRKAIQRLEGSLESGEKVKTEEELIALWKMLNVTKSALAGEEAKAERVKVQLKDLFKFSKDVQPLSDGVIAAMREYQRAKSKAFKLSTDTESELRQLFQNPLREFLYWKPLAESVLDTTVTAANSGTVNPNALDRIEKLLEESKAIKGKLAALEVKKENIRSVLGEDKTRTLVRDVLAAEKERAALHHDLLERKNRLQSLTSQSEEFDLAFRMLHQKLAALRKKCAKENELQPDIIGKEAQLQRLQILLEKLSKLYSPIKELNSKMEASPSHAHQANKLQSDYLTLQRSLENNIRKTKDHIRDHKMFNNAFLDLQRWTMETRQELESYQDGSKPWREKEVEGLLTEVSEKDIQRHQVEAKGQLVIDTSSPEGAALIHTQIKQFLESWESLRRLCDLLSRTRKEREDQRRSPTAVTIDQPISSSPSDEDAHSPSHHGRTPTTKRRSNGKQDILQFSMDGDISYNGGVTEHQGDPSGIHFGGSFSSSGTSEDLDHGSVPSRHPPGGGYTIDFNSLDYKKNRLFTIQNSDNGSYSAQDQTSPSTRFNSSAHGTNSPGRSEDLDMKSSGRKAIYITSSTDSDGYPSSNASVTDQNKTSNRGGSGLAGNWNRISNLEDKDGSPSGDRSAAQSVRNPTRGILSAGTPSEDNNRYRVNVSGKSASSLSNTEGDSVHNGGSSRISSPAGGSPSADRSPQSIRNPTERNTSAGTSRISSPAEGSPSADRSPQSVRNPTERNISGGTSRGQQRGGLDVNSASFKISSKKVKRSTGFIADNNPTSEGDQSSPSSAGTSGTSRRNRKLISLAESVDVMDSPPAQSMTSEDRMKLLLEFEKWLQVENARLNRICAMEVTSGDAGKTRQSKIQKLQSRVPQGQKLFETLLRCRSAMAVTEDLRLEDLRYRWMLYKSKLRDSGSHKGAKLAQETRGVTKKSGGICSFLHRVCCAALPLQLLLLLLLLLAFLLPLVYENQNCALANNFARSFNLMLKYDGPPPT